MDITKGKFLFVSVIWVLNAQCVYSSYYSSSQQSGNLENSLLDSHHINVRAITDRATEYNGNLTAQCEKDYNRYKLALALRRIWAINMLDASGKFEAGFNEGNKYFEGDYQQCHGETVKENVSDPEAIRGLYCTTMWYRPFVTWSIVFTKGRGLCLPHSCTDTDALAIVYIEDYIRFPTPSQKLVVYCARDRDLASDPAAIFTIVFLSLCGLGVICISTYHGFHLKSVRTNNTKEKQFANIKNTEKANGFEQHNKDDAGLNSTKEAKDIEHDINQEQDCIRRGDIDDVMKTFREPDVEQTVSESKPNQSSYQINTQGNNLQTSVLKRSLLTFSLFNTVPYVLSAKHQPGSLKCVHAIRFLSMGWVILGHTWTLGLYATNVPVVRNRYPYYDKAGQMAHSAVNNVSLSVEAFFIITALLVTLSFLKTLDKQKGKVTARQMAIYYVHRYWRLTPVYMIILMFYANLFYYLGKGPFFRPHISDVDRCKEIWWKNLLYLNNLIRPQDGECMGQSWYLANDFQFYCMSPLFIILFYKKPVAGVVFTILGFCGTTAANFYIFYEIVYLGTADFYYDVYVRPWTHSQTYFMGMMLGYIIYKTKGKVRINKYVAVCGWILAAVLSYIAVYAQYFTNPLCEGPFCGPWTKAGTVVFLSLQRPVIGLSITWTIFACVTGNGGIINMIFSWKGWVPLARLTYVAYLFHPILMFYFVYARPVKIYVYDWLMIYVFCGHVMLTLAAAFFITLIFEVPLMKLEKLFLSGRRTY